MSPMTNAPPKHRNEQDALDQLVASRPRIQGRHYQLSPESSSLAFERSGQPYVNRSEMSARAVISTSTVDRVGDVLIPTGCRLTNFAKNPVVLWAHGLEGISQPIATSCDPTGQLSVTISTDDIQATAWFSQTSLEASQIFELIDEGIVRATSVRETPIKTRIQRDSNVGEILIVEEWDLEEWSWCAVGVNPDAVAKTLHRNRLGGRPIVPSILKSLMAVSPTTRRFGVGLSRENSVTDHTFADNCDAVGAQPNDSTEWTDTMIDDSAQPYGSTVVSAIHTSLMSTCQNAETAMATLENPPVRDGLNAILEVLRNQLAVLEGLHATNYPDQSDLKSDDAANSDSEELKAFLASGQLASLHVLGLGARLKGMIAARNLTSVQRKTLSTVSEQLTKLVVPLKPNSVDEDTGKILALQQSIQELTGLINRIKA